MTVCRTAVEPFFSVSWGSGQSDHMQGGGFDVFLGYSFPAFSLRRLVAQLQAQFVVNAMGLLQVDLPPFTTQKDMDASVAVPDACSANLFDPGFETGLLAATGFVMMVERSNSRTPHARLIDTPHSSQTAVASSRLRAGLRFFGE